MKIAVLDFGVGEVIIKDVPREYEELDGDDILTNMGFSMGCTEYLVVDGGLPITIDTEGMASKMTLN